jgi:hypothetical protein
VQRTFAEKNARAWDRRGKETNLRSRFNPNPIRGLPTKAGIHDQVISL